MVESFILWLSTKDPNNAADLFLFFIFTIFFFSIIFIIKNKHYDFTSYAPALLTTLGILGTFVGITIGLSSFEFGDQQEIDKSIPRLLGGLRMAFITSILGMGCSILTKGFISWKNSRMEDTKVDVTPSQIYNILVEQKSTLESVRGALSGEGESNVVTQLQKMRTDINDGLKDVQKFFGEKIESINDNISGANDNSLVVHVQKLRSDVNGRALEIRNDLESFANKLSEMATKHLIEALNNVIRDFNQNLTEQFGDNFKQLNQAVEKLVTWQEQYREQMEEMKILMDQSIESMKSGADSLEIIQERASSIPPTMDKLKEVLEVIGLELSDLEGHLNAFAEIRIKAEEAVPAIALQVKEVSSLVEQTVEQGKGLHKKFVGDFTEMIDWVTAKLKDTANDITKENEKIVETMQRSTENTSNAIIKVIKELEEAGNNVKDEGLKIVQGLENEFKKSTNTVSSHMKTIFDEQSKMLDELSSSLSENIQKVFQNQSSELGRLTASIREEAQKASIERTKIIENQINEHLKAIDDALEKEIQRAMQQMANNLGSISQKILKDYDVFMETVKQICRKTEINRNA